MERAETLGDLDDAALEAALVGRYAAAERAHAEALALLGEVARRGTWQADGRVSLAVWLTERVPSLSRTQASIEVRLARLLADRGVVREALVSTALTVGHVAALERVANPRTAACLDRDEVLLVELAGSLTIDQYRTATTQWSLHADPQGTPPDDPTHNRFDVVPVGGRFRISGDVDAVLGAAVKEAVEAQVSRRYRAESDTQRAATTPARRRAAALGDLVAASAETVQDGPRRARTSLTVVCRLEDLSDIAPDHLHQTAAGGWITGSTLERLSCDASVARVVFGPAGEPIDLGRASRLPSPAQRRALLARDGGCAVDGCDAPAWLCEAHHLLHWTKGGPTDLDNLALICRWHHRRAHAKDWDLRRDADGIIRCRRTTPALAA